MPRKPITIEIEFTEFATHAEALRHAWAAGSHAAILLGGRKLVVRREDADRLEGLGAMFAYLGEHNGRIVTVPVNDR